jgi:hypothetical protein
MIRHANVFVILGATSATRSQVKSKIPRPRYLLLYINKRITVTSANKQQPVLVKLGKNLSRRYLVTDVAGVGKGRGGSRRTSLSKAISACSKYRVKNCNRNNNQHDGTPGLDARQPGRDTLAPRVNPLPPTTSKTGSSTHLNIDNS